MKRPFLTITFIILFAGLNCFIYQQDNSQIYYVDLPAGLETMEFKASITLDQNKRIHKVKFPNGGTETNVFIFDSTYLKTTKSNRISIIKSLTKGYFAFDQEVLLDISSLQRGKYYVRYLSCGISGIFPLTIK